MFTDFDQVYLHNHPNLVEGTVVGTRRFWNAIKFSYDIEYDVQYNDMYMIPRNDWHREEELSHISKKGRGNRSFRDKDYYYNVNLNEKCPQCNQEWKITKWNNHVWKDCMKCRQTAEKIVEDLPTEDRNYMERLNGPFKK